MSAVYKLAICIALLAPLTGCELVADFDRGKIPVSDAGSLPDASPRDAGTHHDAGLGDDGGDEDASE